MVKIYVEIEFLNIQKNYNLKVDKIKKQRWNYNEILSSLKINGDLMIWKWSTDDLKTLYLELISWLVQELDEVWLFDDITSYDFGKNLKSMANLLLVQECQRFKSGYLISLKSEKVAKGKCHF